ncbi:hypothetical protein MRBLBA3_002863 [Bacillus sp. LBA3-1-1.1]|uniref:hypothetical protein n=1 Tax=Bacillus TaxID=1386 RepID=UPI0033951478
MRVEVVKLKEVEVVNVEGQFKPIEKNHQKVPCFITNYAMKQGKDLGLTDESLLQGVFKLQGLANANPNQLDNIDFSALQGIDETAIQKVIYLGCLGANKDFEYNFDEFLERYHYSFEETMKLYVRLASSSITGQQNKFAKGLGNSTKTNEKKR